MFRIGNYYKNLNKKRALENDNKSTKKIKIDLVTLREDCLWYVDYEDKVALSVFKKLDKCHENDLDKESMHKLIEEGSEDFLLSFKKACVIMYDDKPFETNFKLMGVGPNFDFEKMKRKCLSWIDIGYPKSEFTVKCAYNMFIREENDDEELKDFSKANIKRLINKAYESKSVKSAKFLAYFDKECDWDFFWYDQLYWDSF